MWRQLEAMRWERTVGGGGAADAPPVLEEVEADRWKHTDGRRAVRVPAVRPGQPEILVLDADGVALREYDLPGKQGTPDPADPLKGAKEVRAVAATGAEDADTPEDDDAAWALLRGWV